MSDVFIGAYGRQDKLLRVRFSRDGLGMAKLRISAARSAYGLILRCLYEDGFEVSVGVDRAGALVPRHLHRAG